MHIRRAVEQNLAFAKLGGKRSSADVAIVVSRVADQDFDLRSIRRALDQEAVGLFWTGEASCPV